MINYDFPNLILLPKLSYFGKISIFLIFFNDFPHFHHNIYISLITNLFNAMYYIIIKIFIIKL